MTLDLERLARMAEADNWLHQPHRRRRGVPILLVAVVLHAAVFAAGIGALSWYGILP